MIKRSKLWILIGTLAAALLISGYYLQRVRFESREVDDGVVAFKKGEYEKAFGMLTPYAARGNRTAQLNVGLAYALGLGTARNRSKARELIQASMPDQSSGMFLWIARSFEKGDGVPRNPAEAEAWYRVAAESGNAEAGAWLRVHAPSVSAQ